MARRVRLGRMPDNSIRVRTSLPGFDVLTANPTNPDQVSFDSQEPGFINLHQVGLALMNISVRIYGAGLTSFFDGPGATIFYTPLGYLPFCDARRFEGNVAYDDRARKAPYSAFGQSYGDEGVWFLNWATDLRVQMYADRLNVGSPYGGSGGQIVYVIYKESSG